MTFVPLSSVSKYEEVIHDCLLYGRNAVHFDAETGRQLRLNSRTARINAVEVLLVHFVKGSEVVHVAQIHIHFDDTRQVGACRR